MLTTVSFENYRGFKSYRMEGLTPVNLLVGKNNSGKTALLEGIQLLASGGDPVVFLEIAARRGEVVVSQPTRRNLVDVCHFFHGHNLLPDFWFAIQGDRNAEPVRVGISSSKDGTAEIEESDFGPLGDSGLKLIISGRAKRTGGARSYLIGPEGAVDFGSGVTMELSGVARGRTSRVRFVGPDSLNSMQMAVMWDEVTLSSQETDVAAAMRILDERLESVHFLSGILGAGYYPARGGILIGFNDQRGRVPLGSLGDGMRRLMALATAMAFTKGGYLFIDEIDTGLHYSVMADMWKLVVAKAVASGTQVFAATHSWDCIEGLSFLCQREPEWLEAVSVHKIDQQLTHDVPFPGESLVRMVKSDIDPR